MIAKCLNQINFQQRNRKVKKQKSKETESKETFVSKETEKSSEIKK